MASGLPDYYSRSYVNIDQQNISEVAIDIAKQSLANLDININQQTVTELAIDIAKQSIATLGIDIKSQSIGNLAMDIAQQSLGNLAVDIGSQSIGNLDININKQTIGELSIDIAKQTIGQILQRPIYGTAQRANISENYSSIGNYTLLSVSGQGKIYGGYIYLSASDNHNGDAIILNIDGNSFIGLTPAQMIERGLMGNVYTGFSLQKYDLVNYDFSVGIMPDITFETGFEIIYKVALGTSVSLIGGIYYALI